MHPPHGDEDDSIIWGLEAKGNFSIQSAYNLLVGIDSANGDSTWKAIWKWKGPNRVVHFLWLAFQKRLLTIFERSRRHMTNSEVCPVCRRASETALHVLRDCPMVKQVWISVLGPQLGDDFFRLGFENRFLGGVKNVDYALQFGLITWVCWKKP
ncbi:Putative ribonuclease H protein At1g65750 [Linum grandiflorum]